MFKALKTPTESRNIYTTNHAFNSLIIAVGLQILLSIHIVFRPGNKVIVEMRFKSTFKGVGFLHLSHTIWDLIPIKWRSMKKGSLPIAIQVKTFLL